MLHHGSCGTTLHLKSCSPRTSWRYFYTCFYYWENVSTLQSLLVSFWKSEKMWLKGLKIKPFRKVQRLYNLSAFLVIRWLYPPTEFSIAPIKNAGPATGNPVGGVGTAKVWTKDCCKLNGAETFKNQTLQPLFRWFSVTCGLGLKGWNFFSKQK